RAAVEELRAAGEGPKASANVAAELVDVAGPLDDAARKLWQAHSGRPLPWVGVRFPDAADDPPPAGARPPRRAAGPGPVGSAAPPRDRPPPPQRGFRGVGAAGGGRGEDRGRDARVAERRTENGGEDTEAARRRRRGRVAVAVGPAAAHRLLRAARRARRPGGA